MELQVAWGRAAELDLAVALGWGRAAEESA